MKKGFLRKSAAIAAAGAMLLGGMALMPETAKAEGAYVPVYRMYTPVNGEHLYTTDAHERDVLKATGVWKYESVGWYAPAADAEGAIGVYRLNNPVLHDHLYTSDKNEIKVLTTKGGWKVDNANRPMFYALTASASQKTPLYRAYNTVNYHHLITSNIKEYNGLGADWKREGITFYCRTAGTGGKEATQTTSVVKGDMTTGHTIENIAAEAALECDVKLSGRGTGQHAKLVLQTPTSAVSFGIQYDQFSSAPYTNTTQIMVENIFSNSAGQQGYYRYQQTTKDQWHHLMIAYTGGNYVKLYLDGTHVMTVTNPEVKNGGLYASVETAGRINGDYVDAEFKNIKVKDLNAYDPEAEWSWYRYHKNAGITSHLVSNGQESSDEVGNPSHNSQWTSSPFKVKNEDITVEMSGTVSGLPAGKDWDSAYNDVSEVVRFGNSLR